MIASHEIKRCLLLGRIAMTNLGSVLKSRDITLLTKVHIVKAIVKAIFQSHVWMDVRVGPHRRLSAKELKASNCGAGEDL